MLALAGMVGVGGCMACGDLGSVNLIALVYINDFGEPDGLKLASAIGHRRAAAGGGIPLILGYQKSVAAPTDCYADTLEARAVF